jgi:cobalt-zinc-cadmium efflux system membrane fusion protein
MKRLNSWKIPGVAVVVTAALLGCGHDGEPAVVAAPKIDGAHVVFPADSPQLKTLLSTPVTMEHVERIRLNGRLTWDETRTVRVFSPLAGRVVQLLAEPGRQVKAGEPLALISSPDFGQAQAEAAKADADAAVADKALTRSRSLFEQGVIAAKDLQQAEADAARAVAERDRTHARAKLYGAGNRVDQQFVLRAPVAGIVVERNANPGQEVRPDQAQPGTPALFVVSDPARLWAQFDVPESQLAGIVPGLGFSLRVAPLPEREFHGRLQHVGDFLDPTTRVVRARGEIDNGERLLKAEMFASADLDIERGEFARLNANAVILLGDVRYVFLDLGNGRFERREVVAEEARFGVLRVRRGLAAGDKVVTDGALLLQQLLASGAP